jgi:hypothetical protein
MYRGLHPLVAISDLYNVSALSPDELKYFPQKTFEIAFVISMLACETGLPGELNGIKWHWLFDKVSSLENSVDFLLTFHNTLDVDQNFGYGPVAKEALDLLISLPPDHHIYRHFVP